MIPSAPASESSQPHKSQSVQPANSSSAQGFVSELESAPTKRRKFSRADISFEKALFVDLTTDGDPVSRDSRSGIETLNGGRTFVERMPTTFIKRQSFEDARTLVDFTKPQKTVTITIGADLASQPETFTVHLCLLAYHSPFFHAAFNSSLVEARTAHMDIPDIEPSIFGLLVNWLYKETLSQASRPDEPLKLMEYLQLWVLADRFLICALVEQAKAKAETTEPDEVEEGGNTLSDAQAYAYWESDQPEIEHSQLKRMMMYKSCKLALRRLGQKKLLLDSMPVEMYADFREAARHRRARVRGANAGKSPRKTGHERWYDELFKKLSKGEWKETGVKRIVRGVIELDD